MNPLSRPARPRRPSPPTRHRVRSAPAVVGLLLVAALSACGGDDAEVTDSASAGSSALLPAAEGKTRYPLTLPTEWGPAVIEERPERVVAGDHWETDLLAALGVTPVGTNDQVSMKNYVTAEFSGPIASTWSNDDVQYPAESVAAARPDLTVVVDTPDRPENYDELTKIAPVLGPAPNGGELAPWQDRIRQIGQALDLSDRAAKVVADNDAYYEKVRAEHPEFAGRTAVFLHFWGKDYGAAYASTPGSGTDAFLEDLGFATNPDAERFADIEDLSPELIGSIKADVLVVSDASGSAAEFAEFVGSPLFQSLDAVKGGRLLELVQTDYSDITYEGKVIAPDFGHFGWALSGDTGPVPKQAIADFLVPPLAGVLAD